MNWFFPFIETKLNEDVDIYTKKRGGRGMRKGMHVLRKNQGRGFSAGEGGLFRKDLMEKIGGLKVSGHLQSQFSLFVRGEGGGRVQTWPFVFKLFLFWSPELGKEKSRRKEKTNRKKTPWEKMRKWINGGEIGGEVSWVCFKEKVKGGGAREALCGLGLTYVRQKHGCFSAARGRSRLQLSVMIMTAPM